MGADSLTAIRLTGVSYRYEDGTEALDGLDMEISEGQCVAILGPNGAGKSTLLKIMASLLSPVSGKVLISGKEAAAKGVCRDVGIVFQDPDDQIFMPRVWDDIAFGPINLGLGKEEIEKRVEKAMEISGLKGFGDRVPHHLSYGEKKRVALAGVLAMESTILLLDEPTANLDPRGRQGIMEFIRGLGRTVVMATHDIEAAAAMADKIYLLDRKIIAAGDVRTILADRALLESHGLEMPMIARLFSEMKGQGYDIHEMPLTVEEAAGWFGKSGHELSRRKG